MVGSKFIQLSSAHAPCMIIDIIDHDTNIYITYQDINRDTNRDTDYDTNCDTGV
jgi:hypothetical protein